MKEKIGLLILFLILAFRMPVFSMVTVTEQMAINFAKQQFQGQDVICATAKVDSILTHCNGYVANDSVLQANASWINQVDSLWLVFVDQRPFHPWAHECSYLYLPRAVQHINNLNYMHCSFSGHFWPRGIQLHYDSPSLPSMIPNFLDIEDQPLFYQESFQPWWNSDDERDFGIEGHPGRKTHVVIVAGGGDIDNFISFYHDCVFFFKTLHYRYKVPRKNFTILLGNKYYVNLIKYITPNIIHFDNCADTENNTRQGFISTMEAINSDEYAIEDDSQLIVFISSHGEYNSNLQSYIFSLRGDDYITDIELNSLLDDNKFKKITVVLSTCMSGHAINSLSTNGRTIITSCGQNEFSYSFVDNRYVDKRMQLGRFAHLFTSALFGKRYDFLFQNDQIIENSSPQSVNADTDGNGWVSLDEAFQYASNNDSIYVANYMLNNSPEGVSVEHPQYSSTPTTLGQDLAFDHVPRNSQLFIRDDVDDTGKEFNTTATNDNASPDIWAFVRSDITESQLYDGQTFPVDLQLNGVGDINCYVKITNRGHMDYLGEGQYLHLNWADTTSTQSISPAAWFGQDQNLLGDTLANVPITQTIAVGETAFMRVPCPVPSTLFYRTKAANSRILPFNVLAHINDSVYSNPSMITDTTNLSVVPVLERNNIACKRVQLSVVQNMIGPGIHGCYISDGNIHVGLTEPAANNMLVTTTSVLQPSYSTSRIVESGETSLDVNASTLPQGAIVVSLSENGVLKDSQQVIK